MTYPDDSRVHIQNIILEKLQVHMSAELDRLGLNLGFNLNGYVKQISGNFIYELKANILGEKHNLPIQIPENWFEHFKLNCFPKWLLERFPAKYKKLGVLEIYQLYPHIKASIPEERHYLHFAKFLKYE